MSDVRGVGQAQMLQAIDADSAMRDWEKEGSHMMWGYGWNGLMILWMFIAAIFWLGALGVLIWALVRWLGGRTHIPYTTPPPAGSGPSAMEILRQRYARGEIDATTFEQMRERLEASGSATQPGDSSDSHEFSSPRS